MNRTRELAGQVEYQEIVQGRIKREEGNRYPILELNAKEYKLFVGGFSTAAKLEWHHAAVEAGLDCSSDTLMYGVLVVRCPVGDRFALALRDICEVLSDGENQQFSGGVEG